MAAKSNGTIGILTGGGDCPGLNAVIRAVVRRAEMLGYKVLGIQRGWLGLVKGMAQPLTVASTSGILARGGTILGTSRTNPLKNAGDKQKVFENLKKLGIDYVIAVGGDDTLGVARTLAAEGLKAVGVPKTIDNDIDGTDQTFGFDTAVSIVTEAIDRLQTTAESHQRVMVVEIMGRNAGWIAMMGGLAGGADCILIPEQPVAIEKICEIIELNRSRGKMFSIVAVSEGFRLAGAEATVAKDKAVDAFGHERLGGIAELLAAEIEKRTGFETRATVLGHIQRGGSPTAFDRVLGTRYGARAVDLIHEGRLGMMVRLSGNQITEIPLANAMTRLKYVGEEWMKLAEIFCS
ncbi:MAG: 6-phosphofructokinase [Terriglobia bacterium]